MNTGDDFETVSDQAVAENKPEETKQEEAPPLKAIPAILYYQKTYAASCGNNDQKAIKIYKEFESRDKLQRFKIELYAVTKGRVADPLLIKALGAARKGRFGSYQNWALFVLTAINSKA